MTQAKAGPRAALIELLAPVVQAGGADLEDVAVSRAGSRSVVRVVIDRDGGIDLDGVADVSHAVSAVLDDAGDVLAGSFVLEVSTPGVDRPLTDPRHWRRATGRLVKVARRTGGSIVGRVVAAGPDAVTLADPDSEAQSELSYGEVSRAVVQVEFNAPAGQPSGERQPSGEPAEAS